ncbi:MAG: hypothetical protein AAGI63_19010, partial [Planctomycetota bacterium]
QRNSMISAASSIAGVLLGGFLGGRRTKVSTAAKGVGYATQQSDDVRRAEEALRDLHNERASMERELVDDLAQLHASYDPALITLEPLEIRPRKSDLKVSELRIVWVPWQVDATGHAHPMTDVKAARQVMNDPQAGTKP